MVKVKICGITNAGDARVAIEAGADLLGFNFYPKSPRYVTPEQVQDIVAQLATRNSPQFAGVFVDEDPDVVWQVATECGLDYAQLHGSEPPDQVEALRKRGLGVIKALGVHDASSLAGMGRYQPDLFLLDTCVCGQMGGTGCTFDWTLALQAKAYGPFLLAGGLTSDNVVEAVRTARPWGVDVSSGVEARPGRKDPDKVRAFVKAVINW
ncbi:MAG: phosphoribosylanthranilate isomerase [Thermoflexales bacterium]|nr:phosphoribosylanthranilate isomerase [Thermoflexales bacterium]